MVTKLVVYDSVFGNTEKIAQAIGEAIGDAVVKNVSEVSEDDLNDLNVLLVGSPTRAFRPTPAIMRFLKTQKTGSFSGIKAAAFDTRIPINQTESNFLRTLIKLFGYADKKIEKALVKTGAEIAIESDGFGVTDTEGPLVDGELERAKTWAKGIL